ncbi:hypothetical protein BSL78_30028 [Apostichopus japonicus]|uniref:Uncharacterized protein n=1 Tax=Stichopus japonicus TaxID=307972 RepID=A0A2G8JBN9_STIJA|nr:hypothetical protein BSL78_30028 [Apostichopus japonicus]
MLWSFSHTVNLLQGIETDISSASDYNTVYWVGWSLIPPDSLGILITFHDGTISDFSILSIGTDLEDIIADYQFPAGEPVGNIFVNSSAWIVLSIPYCYGTCQQSITVSAEDAKDFIVCEGFVYTELDVCGFVYTELDVCNNNSSCENGADESGCVTATLDLDETIMFPLLTTTSNENIDMIWSIVLSSDARAHVRLDGSLSDHQTLEFGSGVWETGKLIELTLNYQNRTDDLIFLWNSFWIRYKGYYYRYSSSVVLVVTAVIGDDIMVCDESYLVINQTMICDGHPFCPYSDDEIGCVTFHDRLLIAGDINPNPGPQCDNNNDITRANVSSAIPSASTQTKLPITYSREALLNMNGSHRLPTEVWQNLKDLKLNANRPTRRKKRRRSHNNKTSSVPAPSTTIRSKGDDSDTRHDVLNAGYSKTDANSAPSSPTLTDNNCDNDIYDCFRTKGFHCIHLNARSLTPKMSEVRLIASETKPSVFGISESWIDDSVTNCEIEIPGFSVIRNDRNRHGGGVCIYVRSSLAFNPRPDLHEPNIEAVWVEILLPMSKPIIIGIVIGLKPI